MFINQRKISKEEEEIGNSLTDFSESLYHTE